jgi:hypothetical protein
MNLSSYHMFPKAVDPEPNMKLESGTAKQIPRQAAIGPIIIGSFSVCSDMVLWQAT